MEASSQTLKPQQDSQVITETDRPVEMSLKSRLNSHWAALVAISVLSPQAAQAISCNGSEAYCNRRYDEMTFLVAHNASSNKKSYILNMIPKANIHDQDRSIRDELNEGVRGLKIPVFPYKNKNYACHGASPGVKEDIKRTVCKKLWVAKSACESIVNDSNPCSLDPATRSFQSFLEEVRNFMNQNPNEVVTLFIEDYVDDLADTEQEFANAGLKDRIYTGQNWQTLGEMIESHHQLVVFIDRNQDKSNRWFGQFPIYHSSRAHMWSSKYNFSNANDLKNDQATTHMTYPGGNQLWLINHFVTPGIAGDINAAKVVNNASVLRERVNKYRNWTHRKPNFISVDFYEDPNSGPMQVVNEINQE